MKPTCETNWDMKLTCEAEILNWEVKPKCEAEMWNQQVKLKCESDLWNLQVKLIYVNRHVKPTCETNMHFQKCQPWWSIDLTKTRRCLLKANKKNYIKGKQWRKSYCLPETFSHDWQQPTAKQTSTRTASWSLKEKSKNTHKLIIIILFK